MWKFAPSMKAPQKLYGSIFRFNKGRQGQPQCLLVAQQVSQMHKAIIFFCSKAYSLTWAEF